MMDLRSRRNFIKGGFVGSIVLLSVDSVLFGGVRIADTVSVLQDDLFPNSTGVPNQEQTNAKAYLFLILNHSRISDEQKRFIKNGIKWLNEESVSKYKKLYTKLTYTERQNILEDISKISWGESFIEAMLKYILEATLGDPIYGINKDECGWKWLNHKGGLPRPKEAYL